jgi:hypothetical protein
MSSRFRWSSTTTCRRTARTTSTVSAVAVVSDARVSPSTSSPLTTCACCATLSVRAVMRLIGPQPEGSCCIFRVLQHPDRRDAAQRGRPHLRCDVPARLPVFSPFCAKGFRTVLRMCFSMCYVVCLYTCRCLHTPIDCPFVCSIRPVTAHMNATPWPHVAPPSLHAAPLLDVKHWADVSAPSFSAIDVEGIRTGWGKAESHQGFGPSPARKTQFGRDGAAREAVHRFPGTTDAMLAVTVCRQRGFHLKISRSVDSPHKVRSPPGRGCSVPELLPPPGRRTRPAARPSV